jgi:hypothetical protein
LGIDFANNRCARAKNILPFEFGQNFNGRSAHFPARLDAAFLTICRADD